MRTIHVRLIPLLDFKDDFQFDRYASGRLATPSQDGKDFCLFQTRLAATPKLHPPLLADRAHLLKWRRHAKPDNTRHLSSDPNIFAATARR